tara:strand:- start:50 stop:397 length:348 start_codon:yes stop_codon:yes gene_type:complete
MMVSEFLQFEWLHPSIKESMFEARCQRMTPNGYIKMKFSDSNMCLGLKPINEDAKWNLEEYIHLMKVKSHNRYLADKIKSTFEMMEQDIIDLDTFSKLFVQIMKQMDFSLEGVWL